MRLLRTDLGDMIVSVSVCIGGRIESVSECIE